MNTKEETQGADPIVVIAGRGKQANAPIQPRKLICPTLLCAALFTLTFGLLDTQAAAAHIL